jgi:fructose/tagatose bisphosphate aldolase
MKLIEAALVETNLPLAVHLDHGDTLSLQIRIDADLPPL